MHPTQECAGGPANPIGDVSRVLRDAADYLARHGWCQGSYFDRTRSVFDPCACAAGALIIAAYGMPVETPEPYDRPEWTLFNDAFEALDEYLVEQFGVDLYTWNDQPGRTQGQVIGALRTAADAVEAGSIGGAR